MVYLILPLSYLFLFSWLSNPRLALRFYSCSGALKSNIGHLEGASGIAGVIKTILALERAVIPPNANFRQINPRIDAELLRIKVINLSIYVNTQIKG